MHKIHKKWQAKISKCEKFDIFAQEAVPYLPFRLFPAEQGKDEC